MFVMVSQFSVDRDRGVRCRHCPSNCPLHVPPQQLKISYPRHGRSSSGIQQFCLFKAHTHTRVHISITSESRRI